MNIFTEAAKLEEQNCPFAMAQIVDSRGSTPRHSAQMLVRADGSIVGTIGGGMVERKVIEESLQALQERKPRLFHGRMARNGADAVGSDCGGAMSVVISVHGMRPRLVLIGAGHVNRAIAQSAALLGFDIAVADIYRESLNPELFPPSTTLLHSESFGAAVEALDIRPDNFVLIATNNQDREALDKLIEQPIAWLGLLASRRKVQLFLRQLREKGVAEEHIARLHAPVGYNIGAETPQEIAISVLAEILQVKNNAPGGLMMKPSHPSGHQLVVIRGAGDIASGVALRLYHAGFKVIMLEVEKPTVIRCTVAFAQAVFDGEMTVEGVTARLATSSAEAMKLTERGFIPVMVDPACSLLDELKPLCVVDAILAKQNLGTRADMAPVTIALGPGFTAGKDCHAVIETNRGHWLGQVIYSGCAQENTGVPGNIMGHTTRRVIRAPAAGIMRSNVKLGDLVKEGDVIAWIGEHEIKAPLTGMVRGLLNDGLAVVGGFKIGDIDPRGETADFTSVSDKARAIGGTIDPILKKKTAHAAFDERLSVIGLLLVGLNDRFLKVYDKEKKLEILMRILKGYQAQPETDGVGALALLAESYRSGWQMKRENGVLSGREEKACRSVSAVLESYVSRLRQKNGGTTEECFADIRQWFAAENEELMTLQDAAGEALEHAFDFMESVFGESQEMAVFMTELNNSTYAISYLTEYDCERYQQYNQSFMFDENRDRLLKRIEHMENWG